MQPLKFQLKQLQLYTGNCNVKSKMPDGHICVKYENEDLIEYKQVKVLFHLSG